MPLLTLNLLENANSFTNEGLAKAILAEKDSGQWKFAIFSLVQAIELALKEKLRREHYALIYLDVDKHKNTVSLRQAAARLRKLADISIGEPDMDAIHKAVDWRNRIVHHEFNFSTDAAKSVFATLFGFLSDFYRIQFGESLAHQVGSDNWREAILITDYAADLFRRAQLRLVDEGITEDMIWSCPQCGRNAFVIQDRIDTCYACTYQEYVEMCVDCKNYFFELDMDQVLVTRAGKDETELLCRDCYDDWEEELHYYDDR